MNRGKNVLNKFTVSFLIVLTLSLGLASAYEYDLTTTSVDTGCDWVCQLLKFFSAGSIMSGVYSGVTPKQTGTDKQVYYIAEQAGSLSTSLTVSCPQQVVGSNQLDYCTIQLWTGYAKSSGCDSYWNSKTDLSSILAGQSATLSITNTDGNKCAKQWVLQQFTVHYIGNGVCESAVPYSENCQNAPQDCGVCPVAVTTTTVTTTTIPWYVTGNVAVPSPPSWNTLIASLMSWLTSIWNVIIPPASIAGSSSFTRGENQTFNIALTSPVDTDASDGIYQVQYGSWSLVDKSYSLLQQGTWDRAEPSYVKTVSFTSLPAGTYSLVAVLYRYDMSCLTGPTCVVASEGTAVKEAKQFTVTSPSPVYPTPTPGTWTSIFSSIISFIKSLFGWT